MFRKNYRGTFFTKMSFYIYVLLGQLFQKRQNVQSAFPVLKTKFRINKVGETFIFNTQNISMIFDQDTQSFPESGAIFLIQVINDTSSPKY